MGEPRPDFHTVLTDLEHTIQVPGQFISFARGGDVPPQLRIDGAGRAIADLRALCGTDLACAKLITTSNTSPRTNDGIPAFAHRAAHYMPDLRRHSHDDLIVVAVDNVAPSRRNLGRYRVYPSRERVALLLKMFVRGISPPSIELTIRDVPAPYQYRLRDGAHRILFFIAAGFTSVPAALQFFELDDRE